jgi:hypothetical protein
LVPVAQKVQIIPDAKQRGFWKIISAGCDRISIYLCWKQLGLSSTMGVCTLEKIQNSLKNYRMDLIHDIQEYRNAHYDFWMKFCSWLGFEFFWVLIPGLMWWGSAKHSKYA